MSLSKKAILTTYVLVIIFFAEFGFAFFKIIIAGNVHTHTHTHTSVYHHRTAPITDFSTTSVGAHPIMNVELWSFPFVCLNLTQIDKTMLFDIQVMKFNSNIQFPSLLSDFFINV